MRTSRPWPLRSPSHRPAAVGEAAAGILTPPAGYLHDTAGGQKGIQGQPHGRLLRLCAVSSRSLDGPAPADSSHPFTPVPTTGTTTDPRRTTGRHDCCTAVPLGHHARDRAAGSTRYARSSSWVPARARAENRWDVYPQVTQNRTYIVASRRIAGESSSCTSTFGGDHSTADPEASLSLLAADTLGRTQIHGLGRVLAGGPSTRRGLGQPKQAHRRLLLCMALTQRPSGSAQRRSLIYFGLKRPGREPRDRANGRASSRVAFALAG